jgi:hypothetical protein
MKKRTWIFALLPVLAMTVLAIYPQVTLWVAQGRDWDGSFFASNDDEVAYAAYVNSLLEGKPRRNDPFLATEDTTAVPLSESLYSIQFIPAYSIALPSRLLGLSSSSAFVVLMFLMAIASSLAVFKLLYEITSDRPLSMAGVLVVLCLGTAAAYEGELRIWMQQQILCDFFPFLRRYQPGFAFPIFFVFCVTVWRALTGDDQKKRLIYSITSGVILAVLTFSYFYLGTAAAAWLVCLTLIYLVFKRDSRAVVLKNAAIIGAIAVPALIPYAILLSRRSANLDHVQLMVHTRMPEFGWTSLVIVVIVAALIFICLKTGISKLTNRAIFALSFALTPLLLFNQQVITGRSLQPVHYELFISNYIVLLAFVLMLSLVTQHFARGSETHQLRWAVAALALFAFGWGTWESTASAGRKTEYSVLRDEAGRAIKYVKAQESSKPGGNQVVVFSNNFVVTGYVPSIAYFRPLWNPHTSSASGVTLAENKRLFYLYLYYSGYDKQGVASALADGLFEARAALFGSERALPALGQDKRPITYGEVEREAQAYADFAANFQREHAASPTLSYLVFNDGGEPDFTNIDKWYHREDARMIGIFKVYKVRLKP